jgi:hypothetical protein
MISKNASPHYRLILGVLSVCCGCLLLQTGCGPGEEEVVVEEEPSGPPPIRETGRMNLEVDGEKRQVFYKFARLIDKGESFPHSLGVYGKDVEIYGELDADEDGEATYEDRVTESGDLEEIGDEMLNKPFLVTEERQHEPRLVLPEMGSCRILSGKIIPQQFSPGSEGEAPQWNGTIDLVLEDEEGGEHQIYGEIQGTLMPGEVKEQRLRSFRAMAEREQAEEPAQPGADAP